MAVLGKVAGTMLKDNLLRNGVDLQIDSNLMYYDIANRRIGINTITPGNALTVNGSVTASNVYINNNTISSLNGNLVLSAVNGNISANNKYIIDLADPINLNDAVNKNYVDTQVQTAYLANLNVTDGTHNTSIELHTETLSFNGNANQTNVYVTNNAVNISLTPNITIAGNLNSGNVNTTNLYATNTSLTGNLNIAGNINNISGGIFGTSGIFYGDPVTGASAIYGGVPGYTFLPNVVAQFTANVNSYAQINFQNKINGAISSTDYVLTAGNGTDSTFYGDFGIASNVYSYPGLSAIGPNDVYLLGVGYNSAGPYTGNVGNVVISSSNGQIKLLSGGGETANVVATVTSTAFVVNKTTAPTNTTSGALQVLGGVGIVGNVFAGAIQNTPIGNGTASTGRFTSVTTTNGGQVTGYLTGAIGANTPNTGAFTSLTASSVTTTNGGQVTGYLTGAIGANTPNTGIFSDLTTVGSATIGNDIAGTIATFGYWSSGYIIGDDTRITLTGGYLKDAGITDASQANGIFVSGLTGNVRVITTTNSTSSSTGAFIVEGGAAVKGNLYVGGGINGVIGNNSPAAGTFSSLTITGGLQNTPVGNGTPSTGNFTNLTATTSNIGNFYISNNTITVTNANGNINLTPLGNGIVSINSTSAILMPAGNNTNRPANPITGMTRYNSVLQGLEVWDGAEWISAAGYAPSSVIVSDKFTGTGSQTNFTLSQNSTSSGTMVSINGVVQVPDVNYSISGNVLTLVEAPISTDIIEVRSLTTLSSITAVTVGNSSVSFGTPSNSYPITVTVGNVAKALFTTTNTYFYSNVVTSTGVYWPNGDAYASPPGGINTSLQFNNNQIFGGSTYLTYNSSSGNLVSNSTTKSTSLTTGAVVIGNGLAVGGNVFANAIYSDNHFFANGVTITTPAGGTNTMMQFNDSTNFSGATYLQYFKTPGNLVSNSTTTSVSTTTGAIVVGGGVGIGGNLNVGSNLTVSSNAQISSLGIGTAATGTAGEIRATNNITGYYSSDISLKENVSVITNALKKINNIRGVEFDWSEEFITEHGGEDGYFIRKHDIGVIAQEIEAVLPEVVATRENGIKAVKYDRVVALLIEAIKELQSKVDRLEKGQ